MNNNQNNFNLMRKRLMYAYIVCILLFSGFTIESITKSDFWLSLLFFITTAINCFDFVKTFKVKWQQND